MQTLIGNARNDLGRFNRYSAWAREQQETERSSDGDGWPIASYVDDCLSLHMTRSAALRGTVLA